LKKRSGMKNLEKEKIGKMRLRNGRNGGRKLENRENQVHWKAKKRIIETWESRNFELRKQMKMEE
jgi:hypothetical protein